MVKSYIKFGRLLYREGSYSKQGIKCNMKSILKYAQGRDTLDHNLPLALCHQRRECNARTRNHSDPESDDTVPALRRPLPREPHATASSVEMPGIFGPGSIIECQECRVLPRDRNAKFLLLLLIMNSPDFNVVYMANDDQYSLPYCESVKM